MVDLTKATDRSPIRRRYVGKSRVHPKTRHAQIHYGRAVWVTKATAKTALVCDIDSDPYFAYKFRVRIDQLVSW